MTLPTLTLLLAGLLLVPVVETAAAASCQTNGAEYASAKSNEKDAARALSTCISTDRSPGNSCDHEFVLLDHAHEQLDRASEIRDACKLSARIGAASARSY